MSLARARAAPLHLAMRRGARVGPRATGGLTLLPLVLATAALAGCDSRHIRDDAPNHVGVGAPSTMSPTLTGCFSLAALEDGERPAQVGGSIELPGMFRLLDASADPTGAYRHVALPVEPPSINSGRAAVWWAAGDTVVLHFRGPANDAIVRLIPDGDDLVGTVTTTRERTARRSYRWQARARSWVCADALRVDTASVWRMLGMQAPATT